MLDNEEPATLHVDGRDHRRKVRMLGVAGVVLLLVAVVSTVLVWEKEPLEETSTSINENLASIGTQTDSGHRSSATTPPSQFPSSFPTYSPTFEATTTTTSSNSSVSSTTPSISTVSPTSILRPSSVPTRSSKPYPTSSSNFPSTFEPTKVPSALPTLYPSPLPTSSPTKNPSIEPSQLKSARPSSSSSTPSATPTRILSSQPSSRPSRAPTNLPTNQPSVSPVLMKSSRPSISSQPSPVPVTIDGTFELLETVPHDGAAFTQGFELVDPDILGGLALESRSNATNFQYYFESTGLYGQSSVRIVELHTGTVVKQIDMDSSYFGEGLTYLPSGTLVQLTWKAGAGFVYNATTLESIQEYTIETTNGQGWGICYAGKQNVGLYSTVEDDHKLFVSDGTAYLHTWNATDFSLVEQVQVEWNRLNVATGDVTTFVQNNINELEWDYHYQNVLANVWYQDYILRIDPQTGVITHRYNLGSLHRPASANVLNGIAVTDVPDEIWVTGKRWPNMYRIRLIENSP